MSVKKNLTVATLAALLAVPAFGATNASQALHMPSVTAHAARVTGDETTDEHSLWNMTGMGDNGGQPSSYHGHEFTMRANTVYIDGRPYSAPQALEYANQLASEGQSSTNSSNTTSNSNGLANGSENGTNNNANGTDGANNSTDSTQYASKKSLPQTSESNGASKAMAMGAVALGASASFMALSMAQKHRQESELSAVSSEPTVDDGDGKSNNDSADDIDNCYHMIMSNTFANISEDLK